MTALLEGRAAPNLVQTLEGTPGLHPRRPLRQHRAWLQLGAGHHHRAQARRLCGDRSRLRRRPRRREVPRHQVPQGRARARLRWCSSPPSARSRCTAASRKRTSRRKTSRRSKPAWPTCSATSRTCKNFGLPCGGLDQPLLRRHRGRDRAGQGSLRQARRRGADGRPLGDGRRGRRRRRPRRGQGGRRAARPSSSCSIPTTCRCWTSAHHRPGDLPRQGHRRADKSVRDQLARSRKHGLRQAAGLHRQDAVLVLDQCRRQGRADRLTSFPCAKCGFPPAPSSWWSICGEIMTMPGLPQVPAADVDRRRPDGKIVGLF